MREGDDRDLAPVIGLAAMGGAAVAEEALFVAIGAEAEMRDLAAAGQMRALSWQAADAAGNRQGLTISEFGELGGPGLGGCPPGPSALAPNAPTNVTATAGNQSVTAS